MSNSSLVNYTRISPNKTSPRRGTIKNIIIHHMAGDLSVETCGQVFAPVSRQASSNYSVGTDGRIGMYCEEKDRAWTTGNQIDHESVTIEVADDKMGSPWHSSNEAMDSLIKLCADICKRNGIDKLRYTGDKTGNLLMHRWYQNTDCPGQWLGSQFPRIASEVNKILCGQTWVKDSIGWWYRNSDGSYPKNCWKKIDDCWYYFNEKGYALSNEWMHYKNKWYYLKKDCRMAASEWQKVDGYWYYIGSDGSMLDGWQKIKSKWYYLDPVGKERPHGAMVTGKLTVDGYEYYLKDSGEMIIGWYRDGEDWYYYNESKNCQPIGSLMRNHWQEKYYLKDDGKMACNETIIIGENEYTFAKDGKLK